MSRRKWSDESALGGEPPPVLENPPPSDAVKLADYEEGTLDVNVRGRGQPRGKLHTTADGRVMIRVDWIDVPHLWAEIDIDFVPFRALLDWWETGKFAVKTVEPLSDVAKSNE